MKYNIINKENNPFVEFDLDKNESVIIERGSMIYMSSHVELEGKTGGLGKALARNFTGGESIFITTAKAHADSQRLGVAPSILGNITSINVGDNNQWFLKDGVFLASDSSVTLKSKMQKNLTGALFGGTGGLFLLGTKGTGEVLLETVGSLTEIELNGESLKIDTDHVVAWQESLDYDIKVASGAFGFTSGEGLVTNFSGSGKILVQSRNAKTIAAKLSQYMMSRK